MKIDKIDKDGTTLTRKSFWDSAVDSVLLSKKTQGHNVKVSEHHGYGTIVSVTRERGTSSPCPDGTPTATFSGVLVDCGCLSGPNGGGTEEWRDDVGMSYTINQAVTLVDSAGGCDCASDKCYWYYGVSHPGTNHPILSVRVDCGTDPTALRDLNITVLCNAGTLTVIVWADFGNEPLELFFHGTGAIGATISNDLVCGASVDLAFCGETTWRALAEGGTVVVTF